MFTRRGDRRTSTAGRPRAFDERPYKQISAENLFSLPICVIMGLTKSLPEGVLGCATLGVWALPEAFAAAQMGGRKTKAKLAIKQKAR